MHGIDIIIISSNKLIFYKIRINNYKCIRMFVRVGFHRENPYLGNRIKTKVKTHYPQHIIDNGRPMELTKYGGCEESGPFC